MSGTRYTHMRMSIRGFLRRDDRYFRQQLSAFTKDDGSPYRSAKELRQAMEYELAMGREYLPLGKCDNFDPKNGCMGHVETSVQELKPEEVRA